jgi:hypothetical protein
MEVNPGEGEIMFLAELCRFENFFTRHTEFAVVLSSLRMGVVGMNRNTREEAEPKINVTLRERVLRDRRVSRTEREILRFAQNDIDSFKLRQIINNNCPGMLDCGL